MSSVENPTNTTITEDINIEYTKKLIINNFPILCPFTILVVLLLALIIIYKLISPAFSIFQKKELSENKLKEMKKKREQRTLVFNTISNAICFASFLDIVYYMAMLLTSISNQVDESFGIYFKLFTCTYSLILFSVFLLLYILTSSDISSFYFKNFMIFNLNTLIIKFITTYYLHDIYNLYNIVDSELNPILLISFITSLILYFLGLLYSNGLNKILKELFSKKDTLTQIRSNQGVKNPNAEQSFLGGVSIDSNKEKK